MKNPSTTFSPALMPLSPFRPGQDRAEECLNLRLTDEGGVPALTPTGTPRRLCAAIVAEPYCRVTTRSGASSLLFLEGLNLYSVSETGGDKQFIATLTEAPGACLTMDDTIIIMTADGERHLSVNQSDGSIIDRGVMPRVPDIRFVTHTSGTLSASTPPISLTGAYSRSQGTLTAGDRKILASHLGAAYEQLYADAASSGMNLQPRLMAWRVIDTKGRIIARSVPVWVAPAGFQCTGAISGTVTKDNDSKFTTLHTLQASAMAYTTRLRIDGTVADSYWCDRMACLEVLAGPQLHPVDASSMLHGRMDTVDSSTARLTTYMPGTGSGDGNRSASLHRETIAALEHFERSATVIARYHRPFATADDHTRILPIAAQASASAELSSWKAIKRLPPDGKGDTAAIARSHGSCVFMAGTAYRTGDTLIMADITPLCHRGFTPSLYSTVTTAGTFRQICRTEYAGGEGAAVVYSEVSGDVPAYMSPVIVSPIPDATAVTLTIETGGTVKSQQFDMLPLSGGRYSYHIADDLSGAMLPTTDDDMIMPAEKRSFKRYGGTMTVSDPLEPFSPISAIDTGCMPIVAITGAAGSSSAWDFARRHITAWSADAVLTVSVNSTRTALSATTMHRPGIIRKDAIAVTPHGIYAALSDGSLSLMKGSRFTIPYPGAGAIATGYCESRDELWIVGHTGAALITTPGSDSCYMRSFGPIYRMYGDSGRLYVSNYIGIHEASEEDTESSAIIPVAWTRRVVSPIKRPIRLLTVTMQAPQTRLSVELRGDGGAGSVQSLPIVKLRIEGAVNSPVYLRTAAPPRRYLTLRLNGTMASYSSISEAKVNDIQ